MFENLTDRLSRAGNALKGRGRITEDNIRDTLRQVRMALLEADVALPVVKDFIERTRSRALGAEVAKSLTPGQAFIKIIHDELVHTMGSANETLDLRAQPPAIVMLAGLQGVGKTTTAAKLARRLAEREKRKVMLVSADVYRPAAILQLERLATEVGAEFFPSDAGEDPVEIAERAVAAARRSMCDVLIVDTAGRLHVDDAMMSEARRIHDAVNPVETLFVVDSMAGQDAVNAARAFGEALELTGVILTKVDGDARGGVALSVRQVTGKPIKFVGAGEKTTALEPFHPERLASRILGMGDVVSLVEEVEQKVDRDQADRLARKLAKGQGFTLQDLRDQIRQMQEMGGLAGLLDKLPGNAMPGKLDSGMGEREMRKQAAVIDSMTPRERRHPAIVDGSRKRRIAGGAGVQVQEVNRVLKQHAQMQKMMKKFSKGGMAKMMRAMKGRLPPGFG
ncbi:signal recognition particle protein [Wenzhouxiangella sp. XN24]|uniref:signal recognition particle protein n=1 Tax=Wenzhouxiangella sp. XN24 TaxID=2713569 RepID=UPI0013EAC449|nr:signal recognition particle protein [Wenzhouxiangella sp. XN24]NGX15475.1 signal recognition particle protein [Wenzhouxiangella sp. XN24]